MSDIPLSGRLQMYATFTEWLESLLEKRGLTVNRLAGLADVDQPGLNKVFNGKRDISDNIAKKIAPHIGVTSAEILLMAEAERQFRDSPEATAIAVGRLRKWFDVSDAFKVPGDAKYPPSQVEEGLMRDAQRLCVWTSELDNPELWSIPVDDARRDGVFELLAEMVHVAKMHQERHRRGT